jgi:transcription elongation factor Elf1
MNQTQAKESHDCVAVTVTCSHCRKEQVVRVGQGGGFWSTAHQSVLCLNCGAYFDVMLPEAIIGSPFLR